MDASMADTEQLERLRGGVEAWNRYKQETSNVAVNLRGANLEGADLQVANLR